MDQDGLEILFKMRTFEVDQNDFLRIWDRKIASSKYKSGSESVVKVHTHNNHLMIVIWIEWYPSMIPKMKSSFGAEKIDYGNNKLKCLLKL